MNIFKLDTANFTGQTNPEFVLVDLNPNLQILPHCRLNFDGKLLSDDTPIHATNNLVFTGIDSNRFRKILNFNKTHVESLLKKQLPSDIKKMLEAYETKLNYLIDNYPELTDTFVEQECITLNILYSTIFAYVNTGNCLFVNLSKSEFLAEWSKLTKIQFSDKSTNVTKLQNYISNNPDKFPNLLGLRNRSGGCFTDDQYNGILSELTKLPSFE